MAGVPIGLHSPWVGDKQIMPRITAGLALGVVAIVLSACGAVEESRQTGAEPTTTTAPEKPENAPEGTERESDGDTSWASAGWSTLTLLAFDDSTMPPSLIKELEVFSRPRRESDELPTGILDSSLTEDEEFEKYAGEQTPANSRLALENAGSHRVDVYLVPTTKGQVCRYVHDPHDELWASARGCGDGLYRGVNWGASGEGHVLEVEGLVADSVARVEVQVWATRHEADVGGNAFYLRTTVEKNCPDAVESIILHHRDGRTEAVPLQTPGDPSPPLPDMPGCP
jgi:hypothetical protein